MASTRYYHLIIAFSSKRRSSLVGCKLTELLACLNTLGRPSRVSSINLEPLILLWKDKCFSRAAWHRIYWIYVWMMHHILCFGLFFGPFVSGQLTDTAVYLTVFLYFHRRMFCSNEYTLLIKTSVLQMPFEKQTQRRGAQTWKRNRVIWVVYARTQRCDSLNCVLHCFFFFLEGG